MYAEAYLKPSRLSTVEFFLRKSQKNVIAEFAECQYLSYVVKVNFAKVKSLSLIFLLLELIKKHGGLTKKV